MTCPKIGRLAKAAYALGGTADIFGHWLYFGLMQPVFVGFLHLAALASWRNPLTHRAMNDIRTHWEAKRGVI